MSNNKVMVKSAIEEFVTPKAAVKYPFLTKPNTRFKQDGDYRVQMVVPANSKEAKAFIKMIDELMEKSHQNACQQLNKKKVAMAKPPYEMEVDEEGEETGNIVVKLSVDAKRTYKDGNVRNHKISFFDSKRRPLNPSNLMLASDSVLRIAGNAKLWYTPVYGAGVKLEPHAVQVIELVEYQGGSKFNSDKFDEEDDGYESDGEEFKENSQSEAEEGEDDDLDDF